MSERTSELETMIADAVAVSNAFSEYAERLRKESGNNLVVIPADELAALREQVATLTAERDALEGAVNRNAKTGIALLELLAVSMKESRMTEVHNGYGQIAVLSDRGIAIKGLGSIISGAEKKVVY